MGDIMKGHKHGNFHEYYTFHAQECRTTLIPKDFFLALWESQGQPATFTLLDIGCNEGNLTLELYHRAVLELPTHVLCFALGVDLDPMLIDRANLKTADVEHISFQTVDIMSSAPGEGVSLIEHYCAIKGMSGFSFVSLFSITMWIHLNHGDVGFERFLSVGAGLLSNLGSILVEPQPWKCYRNAVRRCRKMNLPLPLHYTDIVYKDPDAAVCACMGRKKNIRILTSDTSSPVVAAADTLSADPLSESVRSGVIIDITDIASPDTEDKGVGSIGCGMMSYSPLGTEIWGRSLLVFHSAAATIAHSDSAATVAAATATATAAAPVRSSSDRSSDSSSDTHIAGSSSSSSNILLYLPLLDTMKPIVFDLVTHGNTKEDDVIRNYIRNTEEEEGQQLLVKDIDNEKRKKRKQVSVVSVVSTVASS